MKKLLLPVLLLAGAACANAEQVVYFSEDFEWLEPWSSQEQKPAGQTVETNNPGAEAPQLGTNKVDVDGQEVSTYEALLAQGYDFVITNHSAKKPREAKAQIYLQRNYLKFGLTGYYSGIVLKPIEVPANTKVVLSFDWSSQRQGSGVWDPTKLVVIVKNGETETTFDVPTYDYVNDEAYKWLKAEIDLGAVQIDKDTKITIRNCDEQWPSTAEKADALRWFIDNIVISGDATSSVSDIVVDEAPVEYYNLQGVRVTNAENGLFIRRQGDKVSKVVLR